MGSPTRATISPHRRHTEAEHQLIHELIDKGHTDEEIVELFQTRFKGVRFDKDCALVHRGHRAIAQV